jgi:hypothetical protein
VQNPEHFDGVLYWPVENNVRGDDETAKSRPKLVAAWAHARKADVHPAAFQDGVNHSVGGIGVVGRDIEPSFV